MRSSCGEDYMNMEIFLSMSITRMFIYCSIINNRVIGGVVSYFYKNYSWGENRTSTDELDNPHLSAPYTHPTKKRGQAIST